MFKTIIWATDGSRAAELALPYAKGLAKAAAPGSLSYMSTSSRLARAVDTRSMWMSRRPRPQSRSRSKG